MNVNNTKITDYKILQNKSADSLADEVNQHIYQGWQPLGGVSQAQESYSYFAQAMVKWDDIPYRLD